MCSSILEVQTVKQEVEESKPFNIKGESGIYYGGKKAERDLTTLFLLDGLLYAANKLVSGGVVLKLQKWLIEWFVLLFSVEITN